MAISEITLYNTLKQSLGDKVAQIVVEGVKEEVKNEFQCNKDTLATKQDLAAVKTELMKYMLAQTAVIVGLVVTLIKLL